MFAKFKINSVVIRQLKEQVGEVLALRQSEAKDAFYNDIVAAVIGEKGVLMVLSFSASIFLRSEIIMMYLYLILTTMRSWLFILPPIYRGDVN